MRPVPHPMQFTDGSSSSTTNRPLRGGPIPVSEADLPFYAAIVGRPTTSDDHAAMLVASVAQGLEAREYAERGGRVRAFFRDLLRSRRA